MRWACRRTSNSRHHLRQEASIVAGSLYIASRESSLICPLDVGNEMWYKYQ